MRIIVVGGGTMGLACARSLSRRGHEVLVMERFGHVHDYGSHSGDTRIFRYSYFEGEEYVRLMSAADQAWQALQNDPQRDSRQLLLERVGLLCLGQEAHPEMRATLSALEASGAPHETLDAADVAARWPILLKRGWIGYFSSRDGLLWVRPCMDALRDDALRHGATLRSPVRVREVLAGTSHRSGDQVGVLLENGSIERADRVVLAAGAYAPALLPQFWSAGGRLARVQRRCLHWFQPQAHMDEAATRLPCWGVFHGDEFFYGFPHRGFPHSDSPGAEPSGFTPGLKVAAHTFQKSAESEDLDGHRSSPSGGAVRGSLAPEGFQTAARRDGQNDDSVDPEVSPRAISSAEASYVEDFARDLMPSLVGPLLASKTCFYTTTQSGDFVIDVWSHDARVVVVGGFSGHGFKFAPEIGELAADLCEQQRSTRQLPRFTFACHRANAARV